MPTYIDIPRWIEDHSAPCTEPRPRKRALAEMDPNAETATPNKRRWKDSNAANEHETDATPRENPLRLTDIATSSSTSASSSKKSRRSISPRKEATARRYAQYPVTPAVLGVLPPDTPPDVRKLAGEIQDIQDGYHVLPQAADNATWRNALKSHNPQRDARIFRSLFTPHELSCAPNLDQLLWLVDKAEGLNLRSASEAAWNSAVHHPLMDMALFDLRFQTPFRYENITTASIYPPVLMSSQSLNINSSSNARRVDFCLAFTIPDDIKRHLVRNEIRLNQTDYMPVEYDAIVMSIETKSATAANSAEGLRQLSTWAQAQITRLRQLLKEFGRGGTVDIPAMPMLLVEGHVWKFVCFKDNDGGNTEEISKGGTFYHSDIGFGNTETLLDACKVVKSLRMFAEWAEQSWWPWLKREIVDGIVERT